MTDTVSAALAAAAARLGADAESVIARLGDELRDPVRTSLAELRALDEAGAKRKRAEIAALVRSPSLAAVRNVHPTWIEAALAELPARARTVLAGQGADETDVWLARWALASLPPMALTRELAAVERFFAARPAGGCG